MSALDDALAKAHAKAPVPHRETQQGRDAAANEALATLCREVGVKLRHLGIEPLDYYWQRTSEWDNYPVEHGGRGWPLQAFMLTEDGQPIDYSQVWDHSTQYDRSGRSHIYVNGDSTPRPIIVPTPTITYADPAHLLFRAPPRTATAGPGCP